MKKNGFTLIELLAALIILGIISTVAITSYSRYINHSREESYKDAEKTMRASAESFLIYCSTSSLNIPSACAVIPNANEKEVIALETLVSNGFMDPVKDHGKDNAYCTGEVNVTNNKDASTSTVNYDLSYQVCLRCSDHVSEGC